MTSNGEPAAKPLRADARRNRARVLEAAEAVFAAEGSSASTEEVARRAGVGIGTVFRHFPTKEALLEAIIVNRLSQVADEAEALSASADPGATLFALFRRAVEQSATKFAAVEALTRAGIDVDSAIAPVRQRLRHAIGELLREAQRAGAVRGDIGVDDVLALVVGASHAIQHAGFDTDVGTRTLNVIVDGLRAER